MTNERARDYVALYHAALVEEVKLGNDITCMLLLLIKHVERDTRNAASLLAQEYANRIHDLEYKNPPQ